MGARRKGRAKFEHSGRKFVWWVDNDTFIRISSEDKSFVVAYLLYDVPTDVGGILAVHGREFPGLMESEPRPIWLIVPEEVSNALSNSMGALVNELITWCLEPTRDLQLYTGTPPTL